MEAPPSKYEGLLIPPESSSGRNPEFAPTAGTGEPEGRQFEAAQQSQYEGLLVPPEPSPPEKDSDDSAPKRKKRSAQSGQLSDDSEYDANPYHNIGFSSIREAEEYERKKANALLANPLRGFSYAELRQLGRAYALEHALVAPDDFRAFELGACLAQNPSAFAKVDGLTEAEKALLADELRHRWAQPRLLYLVIVLCSTCAAVQGMDETVVNGAQLFYAPQFGIGGDDARSTWLVGLVNSAPYLCCAFVGCWLTVPFNKWFGRRGTIFITCLFSAITCFWQGFVNTWWHMFVARFMLGLGIGPKSATVPIYAAECAPPEIRGALVMQWQMWTAFGIMLGYVSDLAFYTVPDRAGVMGLNWRIMMASAMLPAVVCCVFVFWAPESPRWYMSKGRHAEAYHAMTRLRFSKIQAARDVFYMWKGLESEEAIKIGGGKIRELLTVPRNRRALVASELVMFMQQFCGVNSIAYYSSRIFVDANFSEQSALAASLGFGVINWVFAIPAIYTIDTFGRRNLLLFTFPLMALFLLFIGFAFWIPDPTARVGCVALGIYLFGIVYSPGEGPVPFTYSAEAYPLYLRTWGMSIATSTLWFFNFVLAITWPSIFVAFKPQGAFGWYAGWNLLGWWGVLCLMPETRARSLEELDAVFSVPTRLQAAHGLRQIPWFLQRYVLRRDVALPPLIDFEKAKKEGGAVEEIVAGKGNRAVGGKKKRQGV